MRIKHQRFSSIDLLLIRKLTEEGKSLSHLSAILGVGKPTIYYQVRKFKPRIKRDFVVNLNDFQIGELIGAFAGDGNYFHKKYGLKKPKEYYYRIRYSLSTLTDAPYGDYLKDLLKNLGLNPHIIKRKNQNCFVITVNSKEYVQFIQKFLMWEKDKTFSIRLRYTLENYSDDFLKGFARGLMDTDGFLNPGNVVCACISKNLIDNLSEIFFKLGLETTRSVAPRGGKRRPLYYVRVRRKSLDKYEELIGFSNKYKKIALRNILGKDLKEP